MSRFKKPRKFHKYSKKIARENHNWLNPGQYDNSSNPEAHFKSTGPEIYEQIGDKLYGLVAGLGTTGTIFGTGKYLKEKNPNIEIFGAIRKKNNKIPGVRTRNLLREIDFDWHDLVKNSLVDVSEKEAYTESLNMIRNGLLVGPSAGMALSATKKIIQLKIDSNQSKNLDGKHLVFIAPDSCFPYVDEYFEVLDRESFPEIIGEKNLTKINKGNNISTTEISEVGANFIHKYQDSFKIIDVRDESDFNEHHIKNSINIPYFQIEENIEEIKKIKKPIVIICSRMALSLRAYQKLKSLGVECVILKDGFVAWTNNGFEREKSLYCN